MQPQPRLTLGDLAASGELVLDAFVTQLETEGISVPARRYVTPGSGAQGIAFDGEQFNVALASIAQGQPGAAFAGTQFPAATVLFAQWAVLLLRSVPILSGNTTAAQSVPKPAAIDKAGQANFTDIAALTNAAMALHAAGTFGQVGLGLALDSVRPIGPQGGLAGAQLLFSASLS